MQKYIYSTKEHCGQISVERATYLARNLPHPVTVPAEPLMRVYMRSSCGNICYFSVYTNITCDAKVVSDVCER